jgi:hypothetical protein
MLYYYMFSLCNIIKKIFSHFYFGLLHCKGIAILEIDDVRGVMLNFKYDPLVGLKVTRFFF